MSSPPIVVHFDPSKPLVLTTDASMYGIGAVLSHTVMIMIYVSNRHYLFIQFNSLYSLEIL